MCGIVGSIDLKGRDRLDPALTRAMAARLAHRGPDGEGFFDAPGVSLGMRRLSIIDVAGGDQPIFSEDGALALVLNGEIYNYIELREALSARGHRFATRSDTETVIHLYEQHDLALFDHLRGMYAFALWDARRARLLLAVDHIGMKPLYLAERDGRLLFASEVKALLQDPEVVAEADEQMLFEYLWHGFHDHRVETFFKGVYRVPAATCIELPLDGAPASTGRPDLHRQGEGDPDGLAMPLAGTAYWTPTLTRDGGDDPAEFRRRFRAGIERRLLSEAPVGASLSGGLDSSSIVGLMVELLEEDAPEARSLQGRLRTFSAVFDGDPIDEREYIEAAVASTGADTTYVNPTSHEFIAELRDFVWHQEEPVVSTGPYAQWCVMRSAGEQVRVLLDGQGGDELIAGYVPYQLVYLRQLRREGRYDLLRREALASRDVLWPLARRRLKERRQRLSVRALLRPGFLARTRDPGYGRSRSHLKERLLQDLLSYSLPCLLRYGDRNAMAFAVDSRAPYLDQELVEYILSLPEDALVRHGWSRWILRAALRGTLPEKIRLRRWKVGFTTPEMRWIKARRAAFTSLYQSPSFQARPYWDGEAVLEAFAGLEDHVAFLVDGYVGGPATVTTCRRRFPDTFLHYHRAGHGAVTSRQSRRCYTAFVLSKMARLQGASGIHTGTMGFGKMEGDPGDRAIAYMIERDAADGPYYHQEWLGIKATSPMISGGMNALRLPGFFDNLGHANVVQTSGGGAFGHLDGPVAGALSLRQSVDAWSSGIDLLDHAATHRELARAFESFPDDADRLYPSWRSRLGVS